MKLKSVGTWSLGLIALIVIFFNMFTVFADQAELLNSMMSNFPPELRSAFGIDKIDLATVLGFYSFIFIFVQLCVAIQAANYGFGLVSIEESEFTADFLLSKPVSRYQVLNSKLFAALSSLLLTDLVIWLSTFIAIVLFRGDRPYDAGTLVLILFSIVIFQLCFLSVGLVISLLVRRVRNVTPYALGLGFGTYVLNAFSGVIGDVKLELLTPFKHFDPSYIIDNGALDTPLVLLNLAVSLLSLALSYWLYTRRDIPMVS